MKNIFIKMISATALAAVLLSACAKTEETPEPNFPEKQTLWVNLSEGNTVDLSLSPNQDWTVSIPASASDYWAIQNGAQQVLSIGGSAGDKVIQIVCLAKEQDLEDHSVEVSMRMNGETRVIATVTLAAGDPVFKVRQAETKAADVEGYETFVAAEASSGFNYEYSEPLADGAPVKMLWNRQRNGYVGYIQVESNFTWKPQELSGLSMTELGNTNSDPHFRELEIFCRNLNYPAESAKIYELSLTSGVENFTSIPIQVSVPVFKPVLIVRKAVADGMNFEIPEESEDYPYSWLFDETDLAQTPGTIDLIWRPEASATEVDSYILVHSNFNFTVNSEDWLIFDEPAVVEETSNDYEVEAVYHLSVDSEGLASLNPAGDNGKFTFSSGTYSSAEFSLTTPDVTGVFYIEKAPLLEFDCNGKYAPSTTGGTTYDTKATVDLTSYGTPKIMEFVLGKDGKYTADEVDGGWLDASVEQNVGSNGILLQYTMTVTVQPQPVDGAYRQGVLMVFPESVYEDIDKASDPAAVLFDGDGNVKEEYSSYLAANIRQEEYYEATGVISPVDKDYWIYEYAKFEVLTEDPTGNGIESCYKITYASPVEEGTILNSGKGLQIDVESRISEIKAEDSAGNQVTLDAGFWLQINEVDVVYGTETGTHYITMEPYGIEDPEVNLIFVDNKGQNIAVIQCVYDPSAQISDVSLSLAQDYEGLTFTYLPGGSTDIPDGMNAGSYWLMEYDGKSEPGTVEIEGIPVSVTSVLVNPYGLEWLKASLKTGGRCSLNIDLSAYTDGQATESYVLFYDSDNMVPVCIVFRILSDDAGGNAE